VVTRLARWFFDPAPAERLAVFRVLLCTYAVVWVVVRTPFWVDLAQLPAQRARPVGVLSLGGWSLPPAVVVVLSALTLAAGVAAVAGWRWAVSGPALAAGFLVLATHGASWGQVLHTEHLPALHLLVLAAAPAADARSVDARRSGGRPDRAGDGRYGWPMRALALVTVSTYVVAGVAKVRYAGLDWVDGEVLRNLVAHDNLRKRLLGDPSSPFARFVVDHPALFTPASVLTLVVELGAPLALLGGRVRTLWAASAWGFHLGVLAFMAVLFPYPLVGLAFAPLFRLERLPVSAGAWRRHLTGLAGRAPT
jgi:hypothetical protein